MQNKTFVETIDKDNFFRGVTGWRICDINQKTPKENRKRKKEKSGEK